MLPKLIQFRWEKCLCNSSLFETSWQNCNHKRKYFCSIERKDKSTERLKEQQKKNVCQKLWASLMKSDSAVDSSCWPSTCENIFENILKPWGKNIWVIIKLDPNEICAYNSFETYVCICICICIYKVSDFIWSFPHYPRCCLLNDCSICFTWALGSK